MIRLVVLLVVLVSALPAGAAEQRAEKPTLSTEARAGLVVLGGERTTGGLTLGAGARYLHPFGAGPWGVYGGLGAAAVGVGDSWHWLGLLASPEAGAWWASGPWHVSVGLEVPAGQLATCADWGLCLRSWGLYPGLSGRVAVRSESVRIGLELGGTYVDTLPWAGVGWQARIVGAYR